MVGGLKNMDMNERIKYFGETIKRLREAKRYSIRKLAMLSDVSYGQISKIENAQRNLPKPETIKKLANGLGVSYEYLMRVAGYYDPEVMKESEELTEFLKKANVMFHGRPLTEEDKKRVEDVLTAIFYDALTRRKKGE